MCDIRSFIGLYFIRQHIYPSVKHVFDGWYLCENFMNLWMNELRMIFIINSSYAKFMMSNFEEFYALITSSKQLKAYAFPTYLDLSHFL